MRVLLVEDDYAVSQSIETMLKKEGMIVDTTDLGEDGLEIGKLYDYDIIILDLMLPDMNGYEVLKSLRAAKVNTPVLILSGLSEPDKKVYSTAEQKEGLRNFISQVCGNQAKYNSRHLVRWLDSISENLIDQCQKEME